MELLAKQPGQAALEIGYSGQIDVPRSGYYLAARVPQGMIDSTKIRLDADGRIVFDSVGTSQIPYLVLSFESSPQRDEWFQIPELKSAYEDVRAALSRPNAAPTTAEYLEAFKVACLLSEDLVDVDARRLIDKVAALTKRVLPPPRVFRGQKSADAP
jgi:hypothetical protein